MSDWSPAMIDNVALRVATVEDLDALMVVEEAAHAHPSSREALAREFDVDFSHLWCVSSDPPVEGIEVEGFLSFWVVVDEVQILDVAVHPMAQRRGLGRALIDSLAMCSERNEMASVTLEVRASNVAAIGLYSRCGFERVGLRPAYYEHGNEDAVIMTRSLNSRG